jgi:hypothetical protein
MEQTYLCKFDANGRRIETLLACEFTDEEKQQKIADGYIEISEEDWNYYVGNKGNGANGTDYIRGADGKPTDAPPYVPTKEEKLAALDAQYDADKAEIMRYFATAVFAEDADAQADLRAEMAAIDAQYETDRAD